MKEKYTLRNVQNHNHILGISSDLTTLIAVKLWNEHVHGLESVIEDADGDIVNRQTLHLYMTHLESKI